METLIDFDTMNDSLKAYAKSELKEGLKLLPEGWQNKFKLMYGRAGGLRSVEEALAMPIEDVVDEMPEDKLDWAMTQVQNSIKKCSEKEP